MYSAQRPPCKPKRRFVRFFAELFDLARLTPRNDRFCTIHPVGMCENVRIKRRIGVSQRPPHAAPAYPVAAPSAPSPDPNVNGD